MFVSVIVAAYNAERFVSEAIESVLLQTHSDFELIVVDDGSSDGTLEILQRFASQDSRIKILSQENQGASVARNTAIATARSEWIAVMDADDIMEPHRLERQVAFVEKYPDLALTSCLVTWIDSQGRELGRSQSDLTTDAAVAEAYRRDPVLILSHPGCFYRRDTVLELGGYRSELFASEDIDLINRIADMGGRLLVQPEYLLRYRVHSQSLTAITSGWDSTLHRWIRQCSLHRRRGLPEPTQEEYRALWRQVPWYRRANQRRRDLANILYNKATFSYSIGRILQPVILIVASSFLDPTKAPVHVWSKFIRPRINAR